VTYEPFYVWSETSQLTGARHFLTGAGGFLQAIINGYLGLRIQSDGLHWKNPTLPPDIQSITLHGIKLRGGVFDITFDGNSISLRCIHSQRHWTFQLHSKEGILNLELDKLYTIQMDQLLISLKPIVNETNKTKTPSSISPKESWMTKDNQWLGEQSLDFFKHIILILVLLTVCKFLYNILSNKVEFLSRWRTEKQK
jgi:hypothetical protein